MAYGPPPSQGQGQPWQQPGNLWQQQPQQGSQHPPGGPPPGQQQQPPRTRPLPGHYGPVSDDERTWSLMAYVGQFLVGVIAPAVVYLGKPRSAFARRHAAQGLNMGLAAVAVWLVGLLLSLAVDVLIWAPLIFTAVVMFFLVYAGRAANRGEFRRVPAAVAWPLIKK
ncbi:DUF4870 domain-containing protein [Actinomadura sp. WMMB 499]|uniref:DUF4870 domain-containing protein n=1 Tax=Actinomadura sp. WMMB 499 TaxID=1219491 RepID=UPI0012459A19|nr:DUF4870 domain-containing protein [Actinomadura sp. WMMB 499]QFG25641.1 DUF4870 domain-containing protein [Actinomadura sp. WMMB 499]